MLAKSIFYAQQTEISERLDKFPTYVKMKLETELTTANLVILKVVKKKFFEKKKKKREFLFASAKFC